MTNAKFSTKSKKFNVGFQHWVLTIIIALAVFFGSMYYVVPQLIAGFVLSMFTPTLEKQDRMDFIKFDGLVYATVTKGLGAQYAGKPIKAKTAEGTQLINREYIFDITYTPRTLKEHGYAKAGPEWYTKSPILGENAIILEPWLGFIIIAGVVAFVVTLLLTMLMPSNIGLMAVLFDKQIENTKVKLRLQSGFSDEIVDLLIMPDDRLNDQEFHEVKRAFRTVWDRTMTEDIASPFQKARFEDVFDDETDIVYFRNEAIYTRIKEFFSEFVVTEIRDVKAALQWRRNRLLIGKGFRLYMSHHFTEKYSNFVTGLAYGGAAFLIVAVGIRGLKFIPATRPSLILFAISLEFAMLALLAVTLMYTEGEERMDKMLKKMEDANRSQLEALRGQQADIHQLSNALVGQTAEIVRSRVENAIEGYMKSGDHMQKIVAEEIAKKIMLGLRDEKPSDYRPYGANSRL